MDDNLVKVGVWISKDWRDEFAIACRKLSLTMSDVLRTSIHAAIAEADQKEWDQSPEANEAQVLAQDTPDA